MVKLMIFLFVILEVIFTVECDELSKCDKQCHKERNIEYFKYFLLVQQDPEGFCYVSKCTSESYSDRETWTLHGLWPSNDKSHTRYECCGPLNDSFNMSQIEDIRTRLHSVWPNLKGIDIDFWGHEWCCHGRCAKPLLQTEHDYFTKVLALYNKYNFGNILNSGKIYRHNEIGYNRSEILNAFDNVIPEATFKLKLECKQKMLNGTPKLVLWQIKLCLDRKFFPIECDPNETDTCDNTEFIYYYQHQEEHQ